MYVCICMYVCMYVVCACVCMHRHAHCTPFFYIQQKAAYIENQSRILSLQPAQKIFKNKKSNIITESFQELFPSKESCATLTVLFPFLVFLSNYLKARNF
uniref:Uncharacterized protein n=1 Tax=Micrurus lemniscatus lemniscatus TaxID=129467 RepID=A0A2D4JES8_MICLE